MTQALEAVLFDKDGTLVDFHATWDAATEVGLRAATLDNASLRAAAEAIGFDLATHRFRSDAVFIAESADVIMAVLEAHVDLPRFEEACMAAAMQTTTAAPGLPDLLHRLQSRSVALAVVTNDWEGIAEDQLAVLGWSELFDAVVGSDTGYGAKPAPDMVLGALDELGVEPDAALMVGDTAHDLHAGRAAGVETVLVTNGAAPASVAPDVVVLADIVVPSLATLEAELVQRGRLPG